MKHIVPIILYSVSSLALLPAKDIVHLIDGEPIQGNIVDIRGDQLRMDRDLGRGTATVSYPLNRIQKIIFSPAKQFSAENLPTDPQARLNALNLPWLRARPFLSIPESDAGEIALVRAKTLYDLNRHEEAIEFIDEVSKLDWNTRRRFLYAPIKIRCLAALDRFDEAVKLSRTLEEESSDPSSMAFVQLVLGQVELSRKDYATALDHYLYNRVMNPHLADEASRGLLGAAQAFLGLNQPREAVRMLQDILEDYPQTSAAQEAKTTLQSIQEKYKDILNQEETTQEI